MSPSFSEKDRTRWQRDERALWRSAPGGLVVALGPNDRLPQSLTGTGADLWRVLDEPRTVEEISSRLAAAFGASPERVRRDVEPILMRLGESGVLRVGR